MAINNKPTIQPRTVTGIFTNYIAKVLPLAFDDSMSYYECLCALLNYINDTIVPDINNTNDGLGELQGFYEDLQSYVNTYFDNLDVQEEINNKLDAMVINGTLETLIGAYIQPRIDAQNIIINSIDDKVDAVASGSPSGVYATASALSSADPDHNKIYVVSADGKWYYYDTSTTSWTAGGTYQASVDTGDVTDIRNNLNVTDKNIYNLLLNDDLDVYTNWEQGRIDTSGNDETNAQLYRTKNYIPINKQASYKFVGSNGNGCSIRIYDSSKNYSRNVNFPATSTSNTATYIFNQTNDAYFRLSINVYQNDASTYPADPSNIEVNVLNNTSYNTETSTDFNDFSDGITYITNNAGTLTNAPSTSGNYVVLTQQAHQYLTIQFALLQAKLQNGNDTRYKHLGAYYRMFNPTNTSQVYLRWSKFNYELNSQDIYVAFGDSITHGYKRTVGGAAQLTDYPYPQTVGNILQMIPREGANTGSGYIALQSNRNAVSIIDAYDFSNVNLATLFFGTNDWNANIPLGTINDTTTNPTTIYGGIKHCVEKIINENAQTTIILITPINRSQVGNSGAGNLINENNYAYGTQNTAGYTLGDVCDAIVNCAKYYGISYIDTRDGCPINRTNLYAMLIDGLHPSDNGYIKLGQFLASKIGAIFRPYHF